MARPNRCPRCSGVTRVPLWKPRCVAREFTITSVTATIVPSGDTAPAPSSCRPVTRLRVPLLVLDLAVARRGLVEEHLVQPAVVVDVRLGHVVLPGDDPVAVAR